MGNNIKYQIGIPENQRDKAVLLFDEAFGEKLSVAIKDSAKRKKIMEKYLNLNYAIAAMDQSELIGMAGFSIHEGSLTSNISYKSLISNLGIVKGNRAALILRMYERKNESEQLVMDGITVNQKYRRMGIRYNLLSELKEYALENDFRNIRLDVIDKNIQAKKLYEKAGFKTIKEEYFPFLGKLLGFSGVYMMIFDLRK